MSVFRDGNGRSGAADLFWRAACWWWLNVFLCCVSTSFTLLLSVLQRLHPAKTLHGQCQVISENTFSAALKIFEGMQPKTAAGFGEAALCLWEEWTSSRVKEYTCCTEAQTLLPETRFTETQPSSCASDEGFGLFSDHSVKTGIITVLKHFQLMTIPSKNGCRCSHECSINITGRTSVQNLARTLDKVMRMFSWAKNLLAVIHFHILNRAEKITYKLSSVTDAIHDMTKTVVIHHITIRLLLDYFWPNLFSHWFK